MNTRFYKSADQLSTPTQQRPKPNQWLTTEEREIESERENERERAIETHHTESQCQKRLILPSESRLDKESRATATFTPSAS